MKDIYISVPIHPESRKLLSFQHQDTIYQYRSLAFGLSVAPRVFSKLIRFALEPLREKGIRLVYYLDDICLLARAKEEMKRNSREVLHQLTSLGVYSQSSKERFGAKTCARIPWVYFQQQTNADQYATEEDVQTDVKDQTTIQRPGGDLLMSLDGKSFGEDYGNDSSHWRSTAENPVSTARFSDEFKKTAIQLGEAMPIICSKLERTTVVDRERTDLKRLTNKDRYRHQRTGYQYPRRGLRYRVGYNVKRSRDIRVLVRGRKRHFD